MLHESWDKRAEEVTSRRYPWDNYIDGCSDFQTKALERLQAMINTSPELNGTGVFQADLHKAIEIIKNLKAE